MLFTRVAAATLALAASSQAAGIQRRQNVGDVIASGAEDILGDVTGAVADGWDAATRFGDNVVEHVTSFGGEAWTVVSSAGGEAVTLARDGAGVVTSIGGVAVTVATGAVGDATQAVGDSLDGDNDKDNEGAASAVSPSALVGVAATLGFSLIGAYITL